MRKRWLGAAFLGAWLSATAIAQTPTPTNSPGRATVRGPLQTQTTTARGLPSAPLTDTNMQDPVPLSVAHPASLPPMGDMPPQGAMPPAGMMPHQGMPPGAMMPHQSMPHGGMMPHGPMHAEPTPPSGPLSYAIPGWYGHGPGASEAAWYVTLGSITLQRERLGKTLLAVRDPVGVDTGLPAPITAPVVARFHDMEMDWMVGYKGTIGYHWGQHALELSGYYIPKNTSTHDYILPRRLNSFFYNPPVGFEGNNFLWLQADQIRTSLRTALGNAELNYRCWCGPTPYFSWLIGVRYVDLWERLRIFTDDEGLTVRDSLDRPDPTRQATYTIRTHNRIVAPQLGFEWNIPLNPWMAATCTAKGAWGANFLDADARLVRGDGFKGFSGQRSETFFSHVYDAGFFLDWKLHQCAKLRTGYNALWLVHIAEAVEQVEFNLEKTKGRRRPDGDIFYHGPTVELHVVF